MMLLLAAKAACDLALPVFTSQIVDVGIAQSGVEDVAELEHLRAAGVDLLPRQMAYLGQLGLLMLGVAAAAMVLDAAVSLVASRTGAACGLRFSACSGRGFGCMGFGGTIWTEGVGDGGVSGLMGRTGAWALGLRSLPRFPWDLPWPP